MINKLYSFWHYCTTPSGYFADRLQYHHARLLAGLLVLLMTLGSLSAIIQLLLLPHFLPEFATLVVAIAILAVAYGVNRRGHLTTATYLLCLVVTAASTTAFLQGDVLALGFLVMGMMLAAALLPLPTSVVFAALNIVLGVILVLHGPIAEPRLAPSTFIILLVILSALSLLLLRHRERSATLLDQHTRENEENLRAIAENAQEGILINCHGRHVFANRYLAELLGYRMNEIIGSSINEVVHPDSQDLVKERHRRRMAGEAVPSQYNIDLIDKAGERIPVEITASTTQWNGESAGFIMVRDMRERLRQEQALRDSESRWRSIAENTPDFIIHTDTEGKIQFINHVMPGVDENKVFGSSVFDYNDEANNQKIQAAYARVKQTHQSTRYESTYRDPHGNPHWFETSLGPVITDGKLAGIIMSARDITERVLNEQALREAESRWRSITENATDRIFMIDREGIILSVNHVGPGMDKEQVIGSNSYAFLPPEEQEKSRQGIEQVFTTGQANRFEIRFVTPQGDVEYYDNLISPIWQGDKIERVIISARDITQSKLQASHIEHQRELLQSVVTSTPIIIWSTDQNGIFTLSEGEGLKALGIKPGEVVGKSLFRVYKNFPDIVTAAKKVLTGVAVSAQHTVGQRGYQVYYTPLLDHEGKTKGMIGVATDITELIQAEQNIKESEQELSTILHNMQDTFYRTNSKGLLVRISDSVIRLLGYTPEELLGTPIVDLYLNAAGRDQFLSALHDAGGEIENYEAQLRNKQGEAIWVSTNAHYYYDAAGAILGVEGTTRNISEQKRTEAEMQILSSALQQTADLVMVTTHEGIITYVNPAFTDITGYSAQEAVGQQPNLLKSDRQNKEFYKNLWQTILGGNPFSDVLINRRKSGELYYEEKTITPIRDTAGNITHFVGTGKDISERMRTQERLRFMAHHDALTELPNRTLFLDRLKQAMARARWHNRLVAVMFMDLDRFKNINDSLGHNVGDKLLVKLTRRLAGSMRAGDTVARFGGDEFAILLDDIASEQDISALAKKILSTLVPAFQIDGHEFFITASIGVSIFPADGEDSETLLRNADVAMYRAKDLGRNNYQFYSNEMSARAFERLTLENALRYALKREEFFLHYQPQIDIRNNTIFGVEALLRWQHPDLGAVLPSEFISILEETGLIAEVGTWVLQTACTQAKRWQDAGLNLKMAVNLSGRQFNDPDFIDTIQTILADTGLDHTLLELELTESMLMRNASKTIAALDTLNALGVRLAIDDFGTGYSSLGYLRRFPISTLKIDRSFVRDITKDPDDAAITTAIVVMAQSLNLHVVAEGVENEEQLAFLQSLDCHFIQGFYFSEAVSAQKITELVETAQHELN